jgi:hypothetical protein
METGKGKRWGTTVFIGEEREEARRLHDAKGGRHNKERSGRSKVAIDIWRSKMTKENWVGGPNAQLG